MVCIFSLKTFLNNENLRSNEFILLISKTNLKACNGEKACQRQYSDMLLKCY